MVEIFSEMIGFVLCGDKRCVHLCLGRWSFEKNSKSFASFLVLPLLRNTARNTARNTGVYSGTA